MKSNCNSAMAKPKDVNPVTKLWEKVGQNGLMLSRLSEFFKLVNIAIYSVLGSVKDERTFSTLGFMKSKVRNRLGGHLDMYVKFLHSLDLTKKLFLTQQPSHIGVRYGNEWV